MTRKLKTLEEVKSELYFEHLQHWEWSRTKAAKSLGITRHTLRVWIKKNAEKIKDSKTIIARRKSRDVRNEFGDYAEPGQWERDEWSNRNGY